MLYLAIAIIVFLAAGLFFGVPYRQAYQRRKELERRGRIKKPAPEDKDKVG